MVIFHSIPNHQPDHKSSSRHPVVDDHRKTHDDWGSLSRDLAKQRKRSRDWSCPRQEDMALNMLGKSWLNPQGFLLKKMATPHDPDSGFSKNHHPNPLSWLLETIKYDSW